MAAIEGDLIAGRPPRYVQIPTAAAHEGPASLDRWVTLGREQAQRLGVEAVPLVVHNRQEADDPALAAQVDGAGLIYLSGGSPTRLAKALRGTAVGAAIETAWRGGAALAGCSAGAMALTAWVPSLRRPGTHPEQGLGFVPHLRVIPHFDKFERWIPDLAGRFLDGRWRAPRWWASTRRRRWCGTATPGRCAASEGCGCCAPTVARRSLPATSPRCRRRHESLPMWACPLPRDHVR